MVTMGLIFEGFILPFLSINPCKKMDEIICLSFVLKNNVRCSLLICF
jgi:hypothetical protein